MASTTPQEKVTVPEDLRAHSSVAFIVKSMVATVKNDMAQAQEIVRLRALYNDEQIALVLEQQFAARYPKPKVVPEHQKWSSSRVSRFGRAITLHSEAGIAVTDDTFAVALLTANQIGNKIKSDVLTLVLAAIKTAPVSKRKGLFITELAALRKGEASTLVVADESEAGKEGLAGGQATDGRSVSLAEQITRLNDSKRFALKVKTVEAADEAIAAAEALVKALQAHRATLQGAGAVKQATGKPTATRNRAGKVLTTV